MPRRTDRVIKFTKRIIESLIPPSSGRIEWWDENTPHLLCRVSASGDKSFYWFGRVHGRLVRTIVGKWPDMNVAAAVKEAKRITGAGAEGKRVVSRRSAPRGIWTIQQLFDWYMDFHSRPNKRTWEWDLQTFDDSLKQWGSWPATSFEDDSKRSRLIQKIHDIADARGKSPANKVIELVRHMYNLAERFQRSHVPCGDPTKGVKKYRIAERERFLDEDELPVFISAVEELKSETARDFLLLALWTGARRSNVEAMRWDQILLESGKWTIPAASSKNKRAMIISLSDLAVEILRRRKKVTTSEWVLPGRNSEGHYSSAKDAMRQVLIKSGIRDLRVNDLRRTHGSWMAMSAPIQVVGKQLGHASLKSTQVYARLADRTVKNAVNKAAVMMQEALESLKK